MAAMEELTGMTGNFSAFCCAMRTFHWPDFKQQNELVLQELANSTLDYEVMDAYDIGMLRPDQHTGTKNGGADCIHICEPGKLATYTQILQHIIKRRTQRNVLG